MQYEHNKLYPKLGLQWQVWAWNGNGWNKTDSVDQTAGQAIFDQHVRTMPKCPVKLMCICEIEGN